jgi:hypothetical protein
MKDRVERERKRKEGVLVEPMWTEVILHLDAYQDYRMSILP